MNNKSFYLLFIVCLTGFLYQSHLLLDEYLSGETTVTVRVARLQHETPPALTICLPKYLSFESVSNIDQEFQRMYQDYLEHYRAFENLDDNQTDTRKKLMDSMEELYNEMEQRANEMLSGADILSNYSIPIDGFQAFIKSYSGGDFQILNLAIDDHDDNFKIIESLRNYIHEDVTAWKCFTFFSHLCKNSRKFKIDIETLYVIWQGMYEWLPLHLVKNFHFAIHSPNTMPEMQGRGQDVFQLYKAHIIYINRIKTELMDSRFDTNCFEYDLDYKFANFNMRSDCVIPCIQTYLSEKCDSKSIALSKSLLRKELLEQPWLINRHISTSQSFCSTNYYMARSHCENMCKLDCYFEYFPQFNMNSETIDYRFSNTINLLIEHNSMPDILIKYTPKTTFLSLVCDFGGLLGMWLGPSFLTIFDKIISQMFRLIERPKVTVNQNNFKIFVKRKIINKTVPVQICT